MRVIEITTPTTSTTLTIDPHWFFYTAKYCLCASPQKPRITTCGRNSLPVALARHPSWLPTTYRKHELVTETQTVQTDASIGSYIWRKRGNATLVICVQRLLRDMTTSDIHRSLQPLPISLPTTDPQRPVAEHFDPDIKV